MACQTSKSVDCMPASHFGKIYRMRNNISCKATVYDILYHNSTCEVHRESNSFTMEHRKLMKLISKISFEKLTNFKVMDCGLFVDEEFPFLAATTDKIFSYYTIKFILNILFFFFYQPG